MEAILQTVISGLPILVMHVAATLLILLLGVFLYEKVTPFKELDLIKQGNVAASITLAGALLGIAAPLASAMASSINLADIVIWGVVTVLLQILVYLAADFILKDLKTRIEKDERAAAIALAAWKISVGLIIAAAVSG